MINVEEELDNINMYLYQILNKIADIKLDLKEKQLKELSNEILINKLLSGEIKI